MSQIDFNLDFTYENKKNPSLKNVSGRIEKGQCIVLCGSSGCGKSTLLRCINRLIPGFYEGELKGFCRISGVPSDNLSPGEAGRLAASVFQDPRSQFFTMNSSSEIAFGLENFGFTHEEIVSKTEKAFTDRNLIKLKDRNVFSLSSGERQAVAVLAARALDTDIFLLDEPAANLDAASVSDLAVLIKSLKDEGKTIIISEHRLYYLSGIADFYWHMENGEIINKYSASEMLSFSLTELHSLGLRTTDSSKTVFTEKEEIKPEKTNTLKAENICFSYKKGNEILKSVSLEAKTGDVIALTGVNGSGKTTFGKTLAGLYKKSGGSFSLNGRTMSRKDLTKNCIFIMQEAEFQFFTNSVMNELCYPRKLTEAKKRELQPILKKAGLYEARNRHPFSLSGGQMQKTVMLMAYLSEKPVVILDEPTAGLDYKSLISCAELINEMRKTKIVFIITHDTELISMSCTREITVKDGRVFSDTCLTDNKSFSSLKNRMETSAPEAPAPTLKKKKHRFLDPRIILFIILLSMGVAVFTDLKLMLFTFLGVLICTLWQKQYAISAVSTGSMALILLLYYLFPGTIFSFIANFFPRIILVFTSALICASEEQLPRLLAGLRKMHINEKIIMAAAVMFRFFPVLSKDIGIMNQAVKTRGFFPSFTDKIKAVPLYLELTIVPMVFRVIRIADSLSASAETRGIALPGRRSSYIALKIKPADIIIIALQIILFAAGIII